MIHLEFGGSHRRIMVDSVEESHEKHLRVSLSSVTGTRSFSRFTDFYDDLRGAKRV